jgi:hypothetical protein
MLVLVEQPPTAERRAQLSHLGIPVTIVQLLHGDYIKDTHADYNKVGGPSSGGVTHPSSVGGVSYLGSVGDVERLINLLRDDLAASRAEVEASLEKYNEAQEAPLLRRASISAGWRVLLGNALAASASSQVLVDDQSSLSLSQVHERASVVCKMLTDSGAAGGTVCIYLERTVACGYVALGCLMCRATLVDVQAYSTWLLATYC